MRILAVLVVLLPSLAFAQPRSSSDASEMASGDCARARRLGVACVLDMSGETIERGVVSPDGVDVQARFFGKFGSLVRIRKDFIAEILKSANDVD